MVIYAGPIPQEIACYKSSIWDINRYYNLDGQFEADHAHHLQQKSEISIRIAVPLVLVTLERKQKSKATLACAPFKPTKIQRSSPELKLPGPCT